MEEGLMKTKTPATASTPALKKPNNPYFRFHRTYLHFASPFGDNWFALKAEAFARFFGTPFFLIGQTAIVALWIGLNVSGLTKFDIYPFILLNLAFSLQAAYAAPLILLAQTRQADRDKVNTEADARHREDLAMANDQRLAMAEQHTAQLVELIQQNTALTETTRQLSERIEALTSQIHNKLLQENTGN
jgi:uncharacterized membrane protein